MILRGDILKENACCFTGHRIIDKKEYPRIKAELEKLLPELIENGITTFWAGGALGFDTLAAETVLELKEKYTEVKLMLAIPCRDQPKHWRRTEKKRYNEILQKCDGYIVIADEYFIGCMQQRNRFMVDNSTTCIAYIKEDKGGTAYTVKYAEKQGKAIIKLFKKNGSQQIELPF